jgi:hypothetical protein
MNYFKNQLLERHPFSGRCDSAGELLLRRTVAALRSGSGGVIAGYLFAP